MRKNNIDFYEIFNNWRKNTNEFDCFFKTTPFASLKVYEDFLLSDKVVFNREATNIWVKVYEELKNKTSTTLYIFDLDNIVGIDLSLLINNVLDIKPILVFNHIFHERGLIGSKELIEKIIFNSKELKTINPINYALMYDYNRYNNNYVENRLVFNNQYELTDEEVPNVEYLNNLGIENIVIFTYETVKEDMSNYLNYLEECNINVNLLNIF